MKIHYLQHVAFEGLGRIEPWAIAQNHTLSATRFYNNEPLPSVKDIDWLIVMGGPMNIYEEDKYPWLTEEKRFIEQAIQQDKTVIGICLGSQLIADVLGTKVYAGPQKEIGWFPIELTDEAENSTVFNSLPPILRTVLALIEYLKPLMAIGMTIFSIFKSSPLVSKNH